MGFSLGNVQLVIFEKTSLVMKSNIPVSSKKAGHRYQVSIITCSIGQRLNKSLTNIRQFLTRFSTSDWFVAMFKISTEHGSVVPVASCVSKTVNNIENIKRKVVLVIYRNSSATFANCLGLFRGTEGRGKQRALQR